MKQCDEIHPIRRKCGAYDWGHCHGPETCGEHRKRIEKEELMDESHLQNTESKEYGKGERDPLGKSQHSAGAKTDAGKPQASLLLLFGKALRAVAEVGTYGAIKYTRGGWQSVPDGINRYTDALLRHLLTEHYEEYDSDLPVKHAAQVAWNALARLELMLREEENDGNDLVGR